MHRPPAPWYSSAYYAQHTPDILRSGHIPPPHAPSSSSSNTVACTAIHDPPRRSRHRPRSSPSPGGQLSQAAARSPHHTPFATQPRHTTRLLLRSRRLLAQRSRSHRLIHPTHRTTQPRRLHRPSRRSPQPGSLRSSTYRSLRPHQRHQVLQPGRRSSTSMVHRSRYQHDPKPSPGTGHRAS
jgi:hypothetical protein